MDVHGTVEENVSSVKVHGTEDCQNADAEDGIHKLMMIEVGNVEVVVGYHKIQDPVCSQSSDPGCQICVPLNRKTGEKRICRAIDPALVCWAWINWSRKINATVEKSIA